MRLERRALRQSAVIVRCCRPSVRAAIDAASFSHRVTRFPQLLAQAFAAYRRITHAHPSAAASGTPAARSRGQIGRSMPAERWVRAASVSLPFLNRTTLFRNRNAFDIFAFAPPVGAPSFDTRLSRYPCSLFPVPFLVPGPPVTSCGTSRSETGTRDWRPRRKSDFPGRFRTINR